MKRSATRVFLSVAAILCFSNPFAKAQETPQINQFFYPDLLDAKLKVGKDGNTRLIWDIVSNHGTNYTGSVLWILSPGGSLLATGTPNIPANVGFGKNNEAGKSVFNVSNTILYAQASGNTTVALLFGQENDGTSIGLWTYNSAGNLIASVTYGPYGSFVVHEAYFDQLTGKLIVKWRQQNGTNLFTHLVWGVNEFGGIESIAGPFGPFPNIELGKVNLSGKNQLWYWMFPKNGTPDHGINIWEISPNDVIISMATYGPF